MTRVGWKHWLRRLLIFSIAAIIIGYIGLRIFLSSRWAADLVADQLQQMYGGKVTVKAVNIGLIGDTTIDGLELYERNPAKPPWLKVEGLKTDLSVFRLLFVDAMPTVVELNGVTAFFQWNEKGDLALQLPEPKDEKTEVKSLPRIHVRNSRIILRKHGEGDMVVGGVSADLEEKNKQLKLVGAIEDKVWGDWRATATISLDNERLTASLATKRIVRLQTGELRKLPFVPDDVWKTIRLDGQTTARIDLSSNEQKFSYKIELNPSQTTLDFPTADIRIEQAKGNVVIHDGSVKLANVQGVAYGGLVAVDGAVDFGGADLRLVFQKARIDRVDMARQLQKWDIPDLFKGKLSAQADLTITYKGDQLQIEGAGGGKIINASIADQPASVEFELANSDANHSLDIGVQLNQADLAQAARRSKFDLPAPISGTMSASLKASIPLNQLQDIKTFRATGAVEVQNLQVDKLTAPKAKADLVFADGIVELKQLDVRLGEGRITGDARMPVTDVGILEVNVAALDVGPQVVSPWVKAKIPVDGRITATVHASVAAADIADPKAWKGKGNIVAPKLTIEGHDILDGKAIFILSKGVVSLESFNAKAAGAALSASGRVSLDEKMAFQGEAKLINIDLKTLKQYAGDQIPVAMAGMLTVSTNAAGTLSPVSWNVRGEVHADGLIVDRMTIQKVDFNWTADAKRLQINKLAGLMHGGRFSGSATVPLTAELGGNIQLQLDELSATSLAKEIPSPVSLAGSISGKLTGTISPEKKKDNRDIKLSLVLHAPSFQVQDVAMQQLNAQVGYENDALNYRITATTLKGGLQAQGRYVVAGVQKSTGSGTVQVSDIALSKLLALPAATIAGSISADAKFHHDADDPLPQLRGSVTVSDLHWYRKHVTEQIRLDVVLDGKTLSVASTSGRLGGGQLNASLTYDLEFPQKRRLRINLTGADLAAVLGPAKDLADGTFNIDLRASLGPTWIGSGILSVSRGTAAGMDMQNVRLPYSATYSPATGRAMLKIRQGSAQVARGRVHGDVAIGISSKMDLDGKLRFTGVNLESLFQQLFDTSGVGKGDIRGTVSFSGDNVRSLNDVNASLLAKFGDVQAFDFPVFRQIALVVKAKKSLSFSTGTLQAKLNRGTLYVQELSLESKVLKLFTDGQMSLAGRLDLDVLVQTADLGRQRPVMRVLLRSVPALGPIPVGAITQVTDILSNRAIHATVHGTTRNPIVRIRPLKTVSNQAARFFLNQAGSSP